MTNQKTNWRYILLVVILALLVGGGILWYEKKQEIPFTQLPEIKKSEKVVEEKCEDIQDLAQQAKCYVDLGKETGDESYCEKITDEFIAYKWDCYVELAILKNDPSLCWKTGTGSLSSSCWEYFGMRDWKTYRNEEYGFEMRYPNKFIYGDKPEIIPVNCNTVNFLEDCPYINRT